ncbi:MAG: hypothetical protein LBO74_18070 [Candidatus Symbiothrix sp.]|jgi:hypothetical protein|nr:hypothetical protein [Candidatus Symbiothrix sp.]
MENQKNNQSKSKEKYASIGIPMDGRLDYKQMLLYKILSSYFLSEDIIAVFNKYKLIPLSNGMYDSCYPFGVFGIYELGISEKPVGILHSCYSAILMALMKPNMTWLGIEGDLSYCLKLPEIISLLAKKNITFYPGFGEYKSDRNIANYLGNKGLDVKVNSLFRNNAVEFRQICPERIDIAYHLFDQKIHDRYLDSII